jgi:DNA adenine methylase
VSQATDQRYVSPLRYPGGKGKVANYFKILISENGLDGIDYVEPYAGGASVALSLLTDGYVQGIHINDLNAGVYNFWHYLLTNPDGLCTQVMKTPLSIEEWRRQKRAYSDPHSTPEEVGFATFYLNRTNRSGIISRGGVIGGNEQLGRWKIDARFDRTSLCSRINRIAKLGDKIKLSNLDAAQLIDSEGADSTTQKLIYLDPPYYVKGSGLYDNFYHHDDHVAISSAVTKLQCHWVVSYDAAPEILAMYEHCASLRYVLGYSASKSPNGTEVMFFSKSLRAPKDLLPANVTRSQVVANRKLMESTERDDTH